MNIQYKLNENTWKWISTCMLIPDDCAKWCRVIAYTTYILNTAEKRSRAALPTRYCLFLNVVRLYWNKFYASLFPWNVFCLEILCRVLILKCLTSNTKSQSQLEEVVEYIAFLFFKPVHTYSKKLEKYFFFVFHETIPKPHILIELLSYYTKNNISIVTLNIEYIKQTKYLPHKNNWKKFLEHK